MRFNASIMLGTCLSIVIYVILGLLVFSGGDSSAESSSFAGSITKQFIIVIGIFLGGLILSFILKNRDEDEAENINSHDVNDDIYALSHEVLFSSPPVDIKLNKALQKMEKIIKCEAILVGVYEANDLNIIAQKSNSKDFVLHKKIIPEQKDYPLTRFESLDDFVYSFFKTNGATMTKSIQINNKISYNCFITSLKTNTSLKPFGCFCVVLPKGANFTKPMEDKLLFIANSISFSVNLAYKKDALMQANLKFYKQHNEIDESLNIFNENKLTKTINSEAERFKRYLTPLSIIAFSIDDLENISNIMTHQEILALKCDFVNIIKEHIRSTDVFGVWDNDIFCIVASNVDYQGAHVLVNKIMAILKKHNFYRISNLTSSFGITSYSTKDTPALFQSRALDALEKAKLKGGNNFEIQLLV